MKKRVISILIGATIMFSMFTGCNNAKSTEDTSTASKSAAEATVEAAAASTDATAAEPTAVATTASTAESTAVPTTASSADSTAAPATEQNSNGLVIGFNGDGKEKDILTAGDVSFEKFHADKDMTVSKMFVKIAKSNKGAIKLAIYSDKDGYADKLLQSTNEIDNPGIDWKSFDLAAPQQLTAGNDYWLVIWANGTYLINYEKSAGTHQWGNIKYADEWQAPPKGMGKAAIKYCIYAQ